MTSLEREELELAALAAGIKGNWGIVECVGDTPIDLTDIFYTVEGAVWAPHSDDGDCARMEAACRISISWTDGGVIAGVSRRIPRFELFSDHNGDKTAARRRASVRAASQIGRAMREGGNAPSA